MSDLKVTKNDAITADRHNRIVDRLPGEASGFGTNLGRMHHSHIPVVNGGVANFDVADIVGVYSYGGATATYDITRGLEFTVAGADPCDRNQMIGACLEPIAVGERGRVVVDGVALVKCSISSTDHKYARLDPNTPNQLKSDFTGCAKIIKAVATGYAIVAFGYREIDKARWIVVQLDEEGSLDDPELLEYWDGTDPEACDEEVTLYNPFGTLPCPIPGEKVLCRYRPEHDDYAMVSTVSALLGTPEKGQFVVGDSIDAPSCGEIGWTSKKFAFFPCCTEGAEGEGGSESECSTDRSISLGFSYVAGVTGVSIGQDSYGNYCYVFEKANMLTCDDAESVPSQSICGYNCCDERLHHKLFDTQEDITTAGGTLVGLYNDGEATSYVGEKCMELTEGGWTEGAAETLGEGFERDYDSPECCPDEIS